MKMLHNSMRKSKNGAKTEFFPSLTCFYYTTHPKTGKTEQKRKKLKKKKKSWHQNVQEKEG